MNNYLERFQSLNTSEQTERFLIELNSRIESSAYFTDQLKKLHFNWNKETNDLCILRDLVIEKMKEGRNESK